MNQKSINNSLGRVFPPAALIGGVLFLTLGFIGFMGGHVVGLIVLLIGGFVCFTFHGVEINIEKKTIRSYTSYFGIKSGKIKDISSYPFICILKSNKSYKMHGRANQSVAYSETTYDIYLLNKTHQEKILLKIEKGQEQAIQSAKELAAYLDIELVTYMPKVTSRQRNK